MSILEEALSFPRAGITQSRHLVALTKIIVRYELVFLALAAPFLVFPNRLVWLGVAMLLLPWPCRWVSRGSLSIRTALDIPIALLVLTTLVGMIVSIDLPTSWPKFWGIILGVAAYYAFANSLQTARAVCRAGLLLLAIGLAVAFSSFFVADWQLHHYYNLSFITDRMPTIPSIVTAMPTGGVPRNSSGSTWVRPGFIETRGLINTNEVGGTLALLLPVALSAAVLGKGRRPRLFAALAGTLLGVVLILTQALTAITGVIIVGGILLAWKYTRLRIAVLGAGVIGLLVVLLFSGRVLDPANAIGAGIMERVNIWLWGLEALRNEPLTGTGLNSFDYSLVGFYPMSLSWDVYHAHNLLLQVALDLGIPGLIAFIWLLLAFGRTIVSRCRSATDDNYRAIVAGLGLGVLAYMIFGTLDAFSLGAKPGAAFWAMLGCAAARIPGNATAAAIHPAKLHSRRLLPAGLAGAFIVCALVFGPRAIGLLRLNIGTVQAHQALVTARSGGGVSSALFKTAIDNLALGQQAGVGTAHADVLLASANGWLGNCQQAIYHMRRYVESGGEHPPAGAWVAALSRPSGGQPTWFQAKLGIPRTPEAQLLRYDLMIQRTITRWGPVAGWWEPYLQAAIVANELSADQQLAAKMVSKGIGRAAFTEPLTCYDKALEAPK